MQLGRMFWGMGTSVVSPHSWYSLFSELGCYRRCIRDQRHHLRRVAFYIISSQHIPSLPSLSFLASSSLHLHITHPEEAELLLTEAGDITQPVPEECEFSHLKTPLLACNCITQRVETARSPKQKIFKWHFRILTRVDLYTQ